MAQTTVDITPEEEKILRKKLLDKYMKVINSEKNLYKNNMFQMASLERAMERRDMGDSIPPPFSNHLQWSVVIDNINNKIKKFHVAQDNLLSTKAKYIGLWEFMGSLGERGGDGP